MQNHVRDKYRVIPTIFLKEKCGLHELLIRVHANPRAGRVLAGWRLRRRVSSLYLDPGGRQPASCKAACHVSHSERSSRPSSL